MKVLLPGQVAGARGIGQMEIQLTDEQLDEYGLREPLRRLLEATATQLNMDMDGRWNGRIAGLEFISIDVVRLLVAEPKRRHANEAYGL